MLRLALLWFRVNTFSRSERATLIRKAILVSFLVGAITCFLSSIVLDAYFIDTRPRDPRPAEGRMYPKSLKVSYGATVYLTRTEKLLSDLLFPTAFGIILVGSAVNNRWKLLSPYKESKSG